jgi:hypothetical protein
MTTPQDPSGAAPGSEPGALANEPGTPAWPPPGPAGYQPPQPPGPSGYPPPGAPGYPPPGPLGYGPPPAAPPRKTNWLAIAILVGIVVVLGGGFWLFRDRLSGDVGELAVGDCIDEPAQTTSVTDVQHQPCNGPHDGEVFALLTDPGSGDYPGVDHFRTMAVAQCVPAAAAYLGITDFATRTDIDAGYFYPTSESWATGDRGVTCYMYRIDEQKLIVSLHGIGASPLP